MEETKLLTRQIPGGNGACYLRPNGFDEGIYDALVNQREYGHVHFFKEPAVIVDVGANIGLASVCFAIDYPHARIFAIEPEKENFEMLKLNASPYPNIVPLHCALMGKDGSGGILDNGSPLGYRVSIGGEGAGTVDCLTIPTLCEKHGITHIDLLKMDVEGAEKEVFQAADRWISMVDVLVLELHERYVKGCNQTVFHAVEPHFQLEWIGGENFYFSKEKIAHPTIPDVFKGEHPPKLPIEISWDIRDRYDQLYTEVCAEKDAQLNAIQQERDALSEQFGKVCAEKDRAMAELQKELASLSEQFGEVCTEKDHAMAELQKELASLSEQFGEVCAEKDRAIAELQKFNAEQIAQLTAICTDREARILDQQSKLDDYAAKYATPGKAIRTVLTECLLKKNSPAHLARWQRKQIGAQKKEP